MIQIKDYSRLENRGILNTIYRDIYKKKDRNGNKISFAEFNKNLEEMTDDEVKNILYDYDKYNVEKITKLLVKDITTFYDAYNYFKDNKFEDGSKEQCINTLKALIMYKYTSEVSDKEFEIGKSVYENMQNKDIKDFIEKEVL